MSTMSHGASPVPEKRRLSVRALPSDIWASLAIIVMWLAVLFDALWGPDFVSTSSSSMTKIPSAIILALFAWLATKAVAKYGFGRGREEV
jgi:multisubunit Na+/H+ antiporter MnhF subunit